MGKPNHDDSQIFVRTSSPTLLSPSSVDLNMNWHASLSQSDPSILSRPKPCVQRVHPTHGYNSSSYKVSIGHETVNITEIARHPEVLNSEKTMATTEQHRFISARRGADVLSLCFMCFVSACLILIAVSTMHLLLRTNYMNHNEMIPLLLQSTNITPGFLYMFGTSTPSTDLTSSNVVVAVYDRLIRDLATVICLLIIVLNCFCLLVFSIEIYLGCNMVKTKSRSYRFLISSSTSRFIAICCFYASIPALILVMCLFILLNMTLIPAIISLVILGLGLIFILLTLLTYFTAWQTNSFTTTNDKINEINSNVYRPTVLNQLTEEDIDLAKADELSTLV